MTPLEQLLEDAGMADAVLERAQFKYCILDAIDAAYALGRVSGAEEVVAGVDRMMNHDPGSCRKLVDLNEKCCLDNAVQAARAALEGIRGEK